MRKITFGIRKSQLAQAQLDEFLAYLAAKGLTLEYHVKTVVTQADKDQVSSLERIGVGVFAKELERALLRKEIDCAVHSLKDMPTKIEEGTRLSCFIPRHDPRDCLVIRQGVGLTSLQGLRFGTGSPRRTAFLKEIEPNIEALGLRGNVNTRLRKLDDGDYDGIVLAACGLIRLGMQNRIHRYLDPRTFVPAGGQGIVCGQTRIDDRELNQALENSSSAESQAAAQAERKVLEALEIGCQMPFGVFARFEEERFIITAKTYLEKTLTYISEQRSCPRRESQKAVDELIAAMKTKMGQG